MDIPLSEDESTKEDSQKNARKGSVNIASLIKRQPLFQVFLMVAAIGAAFAAGSLYTSNRSLEKQLSSATLQAKTYAAAPAAAVPQAGAKVVPVGSGDHIIGSKDARVVLVEYSDFECPFCKAFQPSVQQAQKDYGAKIAVVYRHFPLSFHQNAEKEAEASECVNELGGSGSFWKFHDAIYQRTTSNGLGFPLANLAPLVGEIGIDQAKFTACLDSGKYATHVQSDQKSGADSGVSGTPTTFILKKDGTSKPLTGALPYAQIKQAIDAALL